MDWIIVTFMLLFAVYTIREHVIAFKKIRRLERIIYLYTHGEVDLAIEGIEYCRGESVTRTGKGFCKVLGFVFFRAPGSSPGLFSLTQDQTWSTAF